MFKYKETNKLTSLSEHHRPVMMCLICLTLLLCVNSGTQTSGTVQAASKKTKKMEITNLASGYVLPVKKSVTLKVRRPSSVAKSSLRFKSSKPKVAKISKTGKITALKKGVTTITVYNKKNKKQKASIKLYVGKRITSLKRISPTGTISIEEGKTCQLKWKVLPAGAAFKKLSWTSSAPKICKVSSAGKLTALKTGSAVITAKARDGSARKMKIKVKVKVLDKKYLPPINSISISSPLEYPYMKENSSITLSADVEPSGSAGVLLWSSSDPLVAKVDAKGVVTAVGPGTAVIYAASGNSTVKDSYTIRVPSRKDCNVTFIAHRGYSAVAPENTRAAFRLAAADNSSFDAIECDVYRTRDGVFVISHDATLKRIFGVDKGIEDCTYDEIKDMTAVGGNGVNKYPNETLCTLEEYLSILKNSRKKAVIELKADYGSAAADKLYSMVSSYDMNERVDIISFKIGALNHMAESIKNIPQPAKPDLYLLSSWPDLGMGSGSSDIEMAIKNNYNLSGNYIFTSEISVTAMHNAGKKYGVWTVDDFETACHFIFDLHVDYVTSNVALFK